VPVTESRTTQSVTRRRLKKSFLFLNTASFAEKTQYTLKVSSFYPLLSWGGFCYYQTKRMKGKCIFVSERVLVKSGRYLL
jgi:hypothetical protein